MSVGEYWGMLLGWDFATLRMLIPGGFLAWICIISVRESHSKYSISYWFPTLREIIKEVYTSAVSVVFFNLRQNLKLNSEVP
jgi:hypothetical protein